jgi:hypothetical protein
MRFGLGKHVSKIIAEVWKASVVMVSSNKILTVSYGTFSCTLEGFDNSFDTMKAIAEYFRDLAQDDRYFGAEPPTPDAEMLARIAEREIARRVEARFEKGNLVLRAKDEAEPPQGDVAPEPSSGAALVGAAAGLAASSLAVADTRDDEDLIQDDIATDIAFADVSALADADEDEEQGITLSAYDTSADSVDGDLEDEADLYPEASADDLDSASDQDDTTEAEQPELIEPEPASVDSVADKLQRIRAVVATKAQSEPEYIEDEHAMSGLDSEDENDAMEPIAELPAQDLPATKAADPYSPAEDMSDDDLTTGDDNLFTDTIAAIVNDQIGSDQADEDEDAILPDLADDDEDDEFAINPQSEIEALRAKIAELEAQAASAKAPALQDDGSDDLYDDGDDDDLLDLADDEDDDSLDLSDHEADAEEEQVVAEAPRKPLIARVRTAKRSEVEAALAAGDIEEYEDEEEEDAVSAADTAEADDGKLTAEQEAEIARELAELHAEIDEDDDWNFDTSEDEDDVEAKKATLAEDDEDPAEASIRKAVKLTSPARAMLTDNPIEEDEDSVERLIDQAETELHEPEGNRRRSAIAHLRAAVAATKADRLLGLGKKQTNEEEPYREDLADAVRPRRPKVTTAKSERPAPVRPAPLKLVAEQRVDVDAKDNTPVRPRRVIRSVETADAQDDMLAGDDTGFAEFAEQAGAHSLPELLEAAAAYMSFVEGRDQFSRPQLMTKLHQAEGEASSREERLRSFGQLLRDGKIEKTGGGRFTASDSIGFKPNERAAG